MRLALVRHPSVQIEQGVCYGQLDLDLAETAAAQTDVVVSKLGGFRHARLWTSPARRCLRLAEALGVTLQARPTADARLREISFGDWEGLRWDAIGVAALDAWAADPVGYAAPGGETGGELIVRVGAFFQELPRRGCAHVIVSHGGPLRVLSALGTGRPVDLLAPPIGIGEVQFVTAETLASRPER